MSARRARIRGAIGRALHGTRWSRRERQLLARFALLLTGYLTWAALGIVLVSFHPSAGPTVYQANPRPVALILGGLAGALLVATGSVVWRIARHSTRVGVAGMAVAILAAIVAVLGMLTVGPFIVPLVAVLAVLALPIPPERPTTPRPPRLPPPGWYDDPGDQRSQRYWDGSSWTELSAPKSSSEGPTEPTTSRGAA